MRDDRTDRIGAWAERMHHDWDVDARCAKKTAISRPVDWCVSLRWTLLEADACFRKSKNMLCHVNH